MYTRYHVRIVSNDKNILHEICKTFKRINASLGYKYNLRFSVQYQKVKFQCFLFELLIRNKCPFDTVSRLTSNKSHMSTCL